MLKTRFLKERDSGFWGFKPQTDEAVMHLSMMKNKHPKIRCLWMIFPQTLGLNHVVFVQSTVSLSWKDCEVPRHFSLSNLMVEDNSEWMTVTWICATMIQSHWRSYHVRRVKLDKMITNVQVRLMEEILHRLKLPGKPSDLFLRQ